MHAHLVYRQFQCVVVVAGTANMMLITSPIVRVMTPGDRGPSLTASVVSTRAGGMAAQQGEIPQFWQLLTAHDSGLIQVCRWQVK